MMADRVPLSMVGACVLPMVRELWGWHKCRVLASQATSNPVF